MMGQNANSDDKLLIIALNIKLWVCSVGLDALLRLSQMVGKLTDESAMITPCRLATNILKNLAGALIRESLLWLLCR